MGVIAHPIVDVICQRDSMDHRYPDYIDVNMDDGHCIRYKIDEVENPQPHWAFIGAMDILQRLPMFGGRKYRKGQRRPEL